MVGGGSRKTVIARRICSGAARRAFSESPTHSVAASDASRSFRHMSIDRVTFGVRATELATGDRSQASPNAAPGASSAGRSDAEGRSKLAAETEAQIEKIAERLQSYLRSVSRSLEFRVDAETGRTVVSVRDAETGELIRQIPSEEVLRLAEMAEDQTIVLVKETV